MTPSVSVGRPALVTASLIASLALLVGGCAPLDDAAGAPPAGSVIAQPPAGEAITDSDDEPLAGDLASGADTATAGSGASDQSTPGNPAEPTAGSRHPSDSAARPGSALELLTTIPVKGRAPKTGYDRKAQFGSPWFDVDRNGCDTRNDMLQRDLTDLTLSGPCKVLSGTLADKYTGNTIEFVRGNKTSTLVQIDHVVALSDAWQKGAQHLSQDARVTFANDPLNLYAADGPANSAKGDGDAATWLPKNRAFRCEYVARQISVKAAYGLWVTAAEQAAMQRVLATCPAEPATASTLASKVMTQQDPDPAPQSIPDPAPSQPRPAIPTPPDVYYKNCTAARAAGAAPVYEGQPGYGRHLDRDGDGAGCE